MTRNGVVCHNLINQIKFSPCHVNNLHVWSLLILVSVHLMSSVKSGWLRKTILLNVIKSPRTPTRAALAHIRPHILTGMHLFISYVSLFSLTNEWQVDTSFGKINRTTQYLRRRDSQLSHHLSPRLSFWLKTTRPCNQNYLELVGNLRLRVSFFFSGWW